MKTIPMIGFKVGRLTVISYAGVHDKLAQWKCQCECGNQPLVLGHCLRREKPTKSCGCLSRELSSKRLIGNRAKFRHGDAVTGHITPEYRTWQNMRRRCDSPVAKYYYNYGGRGIRVCSRWLVFENFLSDMGRKPSPSHSIDRIDVDGNYEPSNCRWATPQEQTFNQRPRKRLEDFTDAELMAEIDRRKL